MPDIMALSCLDKFLALGCLRIKYICIREKAGTRMLFKCWWIGKNFSRLKNIASRIRKRPLLTCFSCMSNAIKMQKNNQNLLNLKNTKKSLRDSWKNIQLLDSWILFAFCLSFLTTGCLIRNKAFTIISAMPSLT